MRLSLVCPVNSRSGTHSEIHRPALPVEMRIASRKSRRIIGIVLPASLQAPVTILIPIGGFNIVGKDRSVFISLEILRSVLVDGDIDDAARGHRALPNQIPRIAAPHLLGDELGALLIIEIACMRLVYSVNAAFSALEFCIVKINFHKPVAVFLVGRIVVPDSEGNFIVGGRNHRF